MIELIIFHHQMHNFLLLQHINLTTLIVPISEEGLKNLNC